MRYEPLQLWHFYWGNRIRPSIRRLQYQHIHILLYGLYSTTIFFQALFNMHVAPNKSYVTIHVAMVTKKEKLTAQKAQIYSHGPRNL